MLQEDNVIPAKWPLARVVEVHPGNEGSFALSRSRPALSRPVTKLAVLLPRDYSLKGPGDAATRIGTDSVGRHPLLEFYNSLEVILCSILDHRISFRNAPKVPSEKICKPSAHYACAVYR